MLGQNGRHRGRRPPIAKEKNPDSRNESIFHFFLPFSKGVFKIGHLFCPFLKRGFENGLFFFKIVTCDHNALIFIFY